MINGLLWLLMGISTGFFTALLMKRPSAVSILNVVYSTMGAMVSGAVATALVNNSIPDALSFTGLIFSFIGAILGHVFILFANSV